MSTQTISVHPSNVGGKINNLPVDTPLVVPNDGKAYEFICTENPLPGGWNVVSPPATGQYNGVEITISHTNGVVTNNFGYSDATLTPTAGAGLDINQNITLAGNWLTENQPTSMVKLKSYTNILQTDLASEFSPDAIATTVLTAFKTASNVVTYGQRIDAVFSGGLGYTGSFAPTGTLNTPPLPGDTDTMYYESSELLADGVYDQIGTGGAFSRAYYTFGMFIPASAATKTYKFQFFLEYV
jgi:hypothetical protein